MHRTTEGITTVMAHEAKYWQEYLPNSPDNEESR